MAEVDILVPVLDRAHRLRPFMEALANSYDHERHDVKAIFLCSPGDEAELWQIEALELPHAIMDWPAGEGDFARKINWGVMHIESEWVFVGADDLHFHSGWLDACLATHEKTGALVIGVNDLGNPTVMRGHYATHMLVHRDYATTGVVDAPGLLLCEEYSHNCVDTELVETARARGMFASATDAHVEHLHPVWKKGANDTTYAKGREKHSLDRQLLQRRRRLWARSTIVDGRQVVRANSVRATRARSTQRWP